MTISRKFLNDIAGAKSDFETIQVQRSYIEELEEELRGYYQFKKCKDCAHAFELVDHVAVCNYQDNPTDWDSVCGKFITKIKDV